MRSLIAFIRKDVTEQIRTGKLTFLGILFVLFGIMNPAVAKLTPWLLEMFSESLEGTGVVITGVTVTAMDSWVQFFKNIPMALIAFILLENGIFTKEYASGTLILSLTKGLERFKVVISKALVMLVLWTVGYFACFFITYAYNAYFWDNSIAQNLIFSVVCYWIFGIFVIMLTVILSVITSAGTGVLLGTGGAVLALYIVSFIPRVSKYLPIKLTDGTSLIYGTADAKEYIAVLIITLAVSIVCFAVSIPLFNKKQL